MQIVTLPSALEVRNNANSNQSTYTPVHLEADEALAIANAVLDLVGRTTDAGTDYWGKGLFFAHLSGQIWVDGMVEELPIGHAAEGHAAELDAWGICFARNKETQQLVAYNPHFGLIAPTWAVIR